MAQSPEFENPADEVYEYENGKKFYLGHCDQWYYDEYHGLLTKESAKIMLTNAIRRYVNHARELDCEPIDENDAAGRLDNWFEHDANTNDYFDHLFPDDDDDENSIIDEIIQDSRLWA